MSIQPSESILIVDFGSQVTQLIARRVREAGVYSEIAPFSHAAAAFARMAPRGISLSGSPASVLDAEGPRIPDEILASGLPMLGICYGQQALMHQRQLVANIAAHQQDRGGALHVGGRHFEGLRHGAIGQVELRFTRLTTDGGFLPPKERTSLYRVRKFEDGWRVTGMSALPAGERMTCPSS